MKILNFRKIIFFLVLLTSFSSAQSERLKGLRLEIPVEIFEYGFNDLYFPGNPDRFFLLSAMKEDSTTIWIRTRLQLTGFANQTSDNTNLQSNILNPLYTKYAESQNMRFIKSILGSVSVGATAYLAYKHLKKYGFLKKK
ncbi:MAG TPA: hypothetical protein PLZ15_06200 [Melioribacteraceae bacterium]|nr:hypothetical protein [Melioribacteraceae bacterium]